MRDKCPTCGGTAERFEAYRQEHAVQHMTTTWRSTAHAEALEEAARLVENYPCVVMETARNMRGRDGLVADIRALKKGS